MKTHEETLQLLRQAVLAKRAGERVKERGDSAQEDIPLCALDREGVFPCSSAQQRLWFLDQLDPAASVAYHIPAALRLQGSLDVSSLQATLDRIVARHESLRTRFVQTEDGLTQQFAPVDVGIALEHVDLVGMSSGAQAAIVDERSRGEALRRFELSTGPLIRGQLLRLSDEDHVLLLTQHHIVSDGWSIGVIIGEIRALYAAITQGLPDPLPALSVQYADYTQWQRQCLQGVALERQLTFWREQLKDAPMLLDLPLDLPRPARQSYEGGTVSFALPDTLTSALRAVSQRQGATLFMTLLSAWAVLMSRLSGQEEVVIGTPVANRQRAEVEPLIGFFVNMVALRISLGDVADTSGLLQQVRARTLDAYAHQAVPFDLVVESVNPSRTVSRSPIFQTIVSMNNAARSGALEMPGIRLQPLETSTGTAQFELALTFTESGSGLVGHLDYAKRLFRHETAEHMAESMQQLLRGMAEGEATPLARLQLQGEAGRRAMLALGCGEHVESTLARVHHAFEQRAAAQPSAPALVFAGHTMDYAGLNQHANRLAHLLIEQGVRSGGRVAICCRRGPAMVVAMLAVLKAGAAYVPLNHDYPEALLAFVLEDTAAPVLITDKASEERLPSSSLIQTIVVDGDDAARIAACLDSNPTPSPTPTPAADLAYVIYTSGSTGQPKGVMVEHRQLEHYLHWARRAYAGETRIDALVSSPFAFDATITSL
ncbi:condensation domain-containing protein, partial [Xanthomonas campestris pv. campestris]|nr:condensation domain-containing protein [Xanthomonas campestris pv. campestris]